MILRIIGGSLAYGGLSIIIGGLIWYFIHYPGDEPRLKNIRAKSHAVAIYGFLLQLLGFFAIYLGRV